MLNKEVKQNVWPEHIKAMGLGNGEYRSATKVEIENAKFDAVVLGKCRKMCDLESDKRECAWGRMRPEDIVYTKEENVFIIDIANLKNITIFNGRLLRKTKGVRYYRAGNKITITDNDYSRKTDWYVHELMLLAVLEKLSILDPDKKAQLDMWENEDVSGRYTRVYVNHLNGVKHSCDGYNLEMCTSKENRAHGQKLGTIKKWFKDLEKKCGTSDRLLNDQNFRGFSARAIYGEKKNEYFSTDELEAEYNNALETKNADGFLNKAVELGLIGSKTP